MPLDTYNTAKTPLLVVVWLPGVNPSVQPRRISSNRTPGRRVRPIGYTVRLLGIV